MKNLIKKIEEDNFWFNGWVLINKFITIIIGGRGIGKTYSILKGHIVDDVKIIYLRRTVTELKISCTAELNPYKTINLDMGLDVRVCHLAESVYAIIEYKDDKPFKHRGLAGALSTFGNLRGADMSEIEMIVFDEFINSGMYNLKEEAYALFNMIETANRNRELMGREPIKLVLLANSNRLDSDILVEFNVVDIIRKMNINKVIEYSDEERGLDIYLPADSPVSKAKEETALYKFARGTRFYEMAIDNNFSDDFDVISKVDYKMLKPVVAYKDITIYKDKQGGFIYISRRKADCIRYDEKNENAFLLRYKSYIATWKRHNKIKYIDYSLKLEIDRLLNKKIQ